MFPQANGVSEKHIYRAENRNKNKEKRTGFFGWSSKAKEMVPATENAPPTLKKKNNKNKEKEKRTGIGFFGWAIAQFSSVITVQRLHSDIVSPQDLRNRIVATVEFTTGVPTLNKIGAIVLPVAKIDEAYALLLAEKVDAVVFDSPSILHNERHEGAGKVMAVGPLFDIQYYGFMFPEGSELREPVNRTLLKLKENGIYEGIHDKWFGKVGR